MKPLFAILLMSLAVAGSGCAAGPQGKWPCAANPIAPPGSRAQTGAVATGAGAFSNSTAVPVSGLLSQSEAAPAQTCPLPLNSSVRSSRTPNQSNRSYGLMKASYDEDSPKATRANIDIKGFVDDNRKLANADLEEERFHEDDSSKDDVLTSTPLPSPALQNDFAPTTWTGITIEEVRQSAYQCHPVTARAQVKLDALQGRYHQKGLPNNPTIGINADDVNEGGRAGRWGVQFGRQVVRGGKRQSDQAIVSAEIKIAAEELKVAKRRLDTDITLRFYDCMVAQEQVVMAQRMQDLATRAAELSRKLFEVEEIARSAVLQAELELEKANIARQRLENRRLWAKRQLAALLGQEELPTAHVGGSISDAALEHDFEATYDRLLKHSPELSVLFADIERARRVAARERLENITDLTWQTTVQYDSVDDNLVGGFQVTWKIPALNQNQGAIYEAERNVAVAQHTADIKTLDLRQRLSAQWQQYVDAQLQVNAFRDSILPKSQETLELLLEGYAAGETNLLEVLMVQRTFFQTQVAYLENVRSLRRQDAKIRGMLLDESLGQ